jgi:hypothetical protein
LRRRLRAGRQGQHRHHLLAGGHPRQRVELRTRCRVSRIETNDDGMATGVGTSTPTASRFQPARSSSWPATASARRGCCSTPPPSASPNGLANSSGLVGKNLMFHPYALIRGFFDEKLDGYRGPHIGTWSMEFYETDPARGFVRGYCYQFSRGLGPGATAINGMADGLIPWGEGHHDAFRGSSTTAPAWWSICEDLPEEHNTVTLDPVLKDSNGIPAPKITYRLGENTQRMLDHSVARGVDI